MFWVIRLVRVMVVRWLLWLVWWLVVWLVIRLLMFIVVVMWFGE